MTDRLELIRMLASEIQFLSEEVTDRQDLDNYEYHIKNGNETRSF